MCVCSAQWIAGNDKALNTTTWLKYDKTDRKHVAALKCSVCFRFNDKLRGARNFSQAYIVGSTNLRTSAFKEHAASDMHKRAMVLLKQSYGQRTGSPYVRVQIYLQCAMHAYS